MIGTIAALTLRGLLDRRRTLLLVLLAAVPVLVGLLVRAAAPIDATGTAADVVDLVGVGITLPLVALVFGTTALGAELEDGTAVYLLTKPIERWRVVAAKLIVAAGLTAALAGVSTLATGLVIAADAGGIRLAVGSAIGVALAAPVYCAVFFALSVLTGRALIVGLLYVLVWEGLASGLFAGIRLFSIRQYARGMIGAIAPEIGGSGTAVLAPASAITLSLALVAAAVALAVWRLNRYEVTGSD